MKTAAVLVTLCSREEHFSGCTPGLLPLWKCKMWAQSRFTWPKHIFILSFIPVFYAVTWKYETIQWKKTSTWPEQPLSAFRFQFCVIPALWAPSLGCSLWMEKALPEGQVLSPSTSWFLQLGHPMLYSHPIYRPSVTLSHTTKSVLNRHSVQR